VIEHVPDQRLHLAEIDRVLRPGGIAYLATPNKYWLTDPHFKLPFVSWLPRGLAEWYVRRACHGRHWDIYPLSYRRLRSLTRGAFVLHDMTPDVVKAPSRFGLNVPAPARAVMERAPRPLLRVASVAAPSFIVILRKR
jgi:SAM-dependent methyltransferase